MPYFSLRPPVPSRRFLRPPGPIPPSFGTAKALFVSNGGSDSGLFPEPFSGNPNRPYNQFYAALKTRSEFQLVSSPAEADLVLELRLTAPDGPSVANKRHGASDPLPMLRLVVYDRKTHYVLWVLTESIEGALLQKSHDRNFDQALSNLVLDFESLTGKLPAAHP